jgi:sigma-54-specific transcriptional regulator
MHTLYSKLLILLGTQDVQQTLEQVCDLAVQLCDLQQVHIFLLSEDGLSLSEHKSAQPQDWDPLDFDAPFAHVLHNAQSQLITANKLVYWRSHVDWDHWLTKQGIAGPIHLSAITHNTAHQGEQVLGITVAYGTESQLADLDRNIHFQFIQQFTGQWLQLLAQLKSQKQAGSLLALSLKSHQQTQTSELDSQALEQKLVGSTVIMQALRKQIIKAAQSPLSVLIQGETGTGKELVAQAVKEYSSRKKQAFIAINCAAIPETLLESELFGHQKGAFSGATKDKDGLLKQADGGTLFLDEIGDMPLALQAKLLRVLETKTFRPVGGKVDLHSDFRLVAATHVELQQGQKHSQFRLDLYHRLSQYVLRIPSLSERLGDLPELVDTFIKTYNQLSRKNIIGIGYHALQLLEKNAFSGNVRELKHLIDFACAMTEDGQEIELSIMQQCFATKYSGHTTTVLGNGQNHNNHQPQSLHGITDLNQAMVAFERSIICSRLDVFNGRRSDAAESLGIPKRTLAHKCQKMEIDNK